MTHISKKLLLPLLAIGMTLALAAAAPTAAHAQTSASLQVNFGNAPHWSTVSGTGVRRIRDGEGPDYDVFRYGGSYYAMNNDQWYRSRTMRGQYSPIASRQVPSAFSRVPRNHWRHYPTNWSGQDNGHQGDRNHQNPSDGGGHR